MTVGTKVITLSGFFVNLVVGPNCKYGHCKREHILVLLSFLVCDQYDVGTKVITLSGFFVNLVVGPNCNYGHCKR